MVDRKAEIERAARAIEKELKVEMWEDEKTYTSEVGNIEDAATAAITPLLDRLDALLMRPDNDHTADATLRGANTNRNVVERKVRAALTAKPRHSERGCEMNLEPDAREAALAVEAVLEKTKAVSWEATLSPVMLSIAISLKRIADNLETKS
ncbi:MAG: hypothetical protein H0W71_09370 [Sphingomonas sp.]|nr:hypothetical protein [Sphingomonas sp.]